MCGPPLYSYARIAALHVLGPSSAWFRIALASMSRASSSDVCGGSAGRSCRWELGVMFGWILRPGQVGRNVHAGSYSPAIKEVVITLWNKDGNLIWPLE